MALVISIVSLLISGLTFWLTKIKKGSLKMTRPSIICFVGQNDGDEAKIFIRTLLYATADQGQYIQNMFVRLVYDGITENFNTWSYGDKETVRGSGLYASKAGVSTNHHFLLPKNTQWSFAAGDYKLEVFVETVGNKQKRLFEYTLSVMKEQEERLRNDFRASIVFSWDPNGRKYISHIEIRPFKEGEAASLLR